MTFREHRQASGLTLQQVGDIIGQSKQAVHAWETFKREPRRSAREQLAAVVGVDPRKIDWHGRIGAD